MDINFHCEKCKQALAIEYTAAGTVVTCPKCGQPTHVPAKPLAALPHLPAKPGLGPHATKSVTVTAPLPTKTMGPAASAPHAEISIVAPHPEPLPARVVVTDFRMPFGSMVKFMTLWSLAAIPAFLILAGLVALVVLGLIKAGVTAFGPP